MNHLLAFPVLAPLLASVAVYALHRRVNPGFAAIALSLTAVAVTGGVATAVAFPAVAYVVPSDRAGWCRALLGHDVLPNAWVAGGAAAVVVLIAGRSFCRWRSYRRSLRALPESGAAPVVVLDRPEPVAYAHPAGSGSVVVSHGLMAKLSRAERLVVLAHERAHLDLHHSRYVLAGELAAAGCPFVAPLARAIRWCTERAADEQTATVVGDRELVAVTIAKAAMSTAPPALAGISGSIVLDRVEAMLAPPPAPSLVRALVLATVAAIALGGAMYQVHHLAEVVIHLH